MKIVFLEYTFMFDPAASWSSLYQFEDQLGKFFGDRGFDAELIKSVEGQPGGKRILYLRPKKMIVPSTPESVGRPKTSQGRMKDLKEHHPKAAERDFGTKKLNTNLPVNALKKYV
jgi:hypothetical protein